MCTQHFSGFSNFQGLQATILPVLVNVLAEYPEPDHDETWSLVHFSDPKWYHNALFGCPCPQMEVLFCTFRSQIWHLLWWLTNHLTEYVDIIQMNTEMGNDECTEMQIKSQDSLNPSVFNTTPYVEGRGLNPKAPNNIVGTYTIWVVNGQDQAFVHIVRIGQITFPYPWLSTMFPSGYDTSGS